MIETLLEDISYNAGYDHPKIDVVIDAAYVKEHFGYVPKDEPTTQPTSQATTEPATTASSLPATTTTTRAAEQLVKLADYEKLSAYFNLDNGTGKIRGIYTQVNAGRAYARVQLAGTAQGVAMHPLQQALQEYPEQARPYAAIRTAC